MRYCDFFAAINALSHESASKDYCIIPSVHLTLPKYIQSLCRIYQILPTPAPSLTMGATNGSGVNLYL